MPVVGQAPDQHSAQVSPLAHRAEWLTDYKKSLNSRHSLTRLNQPFFLATFARYFDRECGLRGGHRGGVSKITFMSRESHGEDSQLAENCIISSTSLGTIRLFVVIFWIAVAPIPFAVLIDLIKKECQECEESQHFCHSGSQQQVAFNRLPTVILSC